LSQFFPVIAFLLLLGRRHRRLWRRGWTRLFFPRLEVCLQITYAKLFPIHIRVPVESRVLHGAIFSVGPVNRAKNDGAILYLAADRTEFVHAPGESHGPRPRDKAKSRPQAGTSTSRGRRCDGSQRFAANAEDYATRGGWRRRARRRSTRSLRATPGVAGLASVPLIAHCQRAKRELRYQH